VASNAVESTMVVSVFWPVAILKAHDQPHNKASMHSYNHGGTVFRGLHRNVEHGVPAGCIKIKHKVSNAAQKITHVGNTQDALRGIEEVNEIFRALKGRLDISIVNAESSGKDDTLQLKMKAKAQADDGLDDIWGDYNPLPITSAKAAKPRTETEEPSAKKPRSKEATRNLLQLHCNVSLVLNRTYIANLGFITTKTIL
jgi:hypothetical protein